MTRIAALLLLLATAVATAQPITKPGPPRRKPASVTWTPETLTRYAEAVILDKDGKLHDAVRKYDDINRDEDLPSAHYNTGDLYRRMERYRDAIKSYKKYLELAPDASDRKDVEATIAKVEATPQRLVVDGDDLDAVVYIDGKLVGPSPVVTDLPAGKHHIDRIGPKTYWQSSIDAKPMGVEHLQMGMQRGEATGNVVFSASPELNTQGSWKTGERTWSLPGRMTLAPGHYETTLWEPNKACGPIAFDIPRGDGITFIYLEVKNPDRPGGCMPVTVRTQRVKLP